LIFAMAQEDSILIDQLRLGSLPFCAGIVNKAISSKLSLDSIPRDDAQSKVLNPLRGSASWAASYGERLRGGVAHDPR
jgi:hypothetical protein